MLLRSNQRVLEYNSVELQLENVVFKLNCKWRMKVTYTEVATNTKAELHLESEGKTNSLLFQSIYTIFYTNKIV